MQPDFAGYHVTPVSQGHGRVAAAPDGDTYGGSAQAFADQEARSSE
jgi:hypothetical protein